MSYEGNTSCCDVLCCVTLRYAMLGKTLTLSQFFILALFLNQIVLKSFFLNHLKHRKRKFYSTLFFILSSIYKTGEYTSQRSLIKSVLSYLLNPC